MVSSSKQPAAAAGRTAPAATREALLHAAGEVFAAHGFHATTVREICRRAGANIAAVNYHFGDKERLYFAVLRHAMAETTQRHPLDGGLPPGAPAAQRLQVFVQGLLGRLFDNAEHAWLGHLMAKEMVDPTSALDMMVAERIRPMAGLLRGIVRELLGPGVDEDTVWLCGFSIVSQCLFYNHCRSVVARLRPEQRLDAGGIARLADHITRFSLAGLLAFAAEHRPRARSRPCRSRRS